MKKGNDKKFKRNRFSHLERMGTVWYLHPVNLLFVLYLDSLWEFFRVFNKPYIFPFTFTSDRSVFILRFDDLTITWRVGHLDRTWAFVFSLYFRSTKIELFTNAINLTIHVGQKHKEVNLQLITQEEKNPIYNTSNTFVAYKVWLTRSYISLSNTIQNK